MSERTPSNRRTSARRSTAEPRVEVGEPVDPEVAASFAGKALSLGGFVEVDGERMTASVPQPAPPATMVSLAEPAAGAGACTTQSPSPPPAMTAAAPAARELVDVAPSSVNEQASELHARVNAAQQEAAKARRDKSEQAKELAASIGARERTIALLTEENTRLRKANGSLYSEKESATRTLKNAEELHKEALAKVEGALAAQQRARKAAEEENLRLSKMVRELKASLPPVPNVPALVCSAAPPVMPHTACLPTDEELLSLGDF